MKRILLLLLLCGCERSQQLEQQPDGTGIRIHSIEQAPPKHQHNWIIINAGVLSTDSNGAPVLMRWQSCYDCGQLDVRAFYPTYETNHTDH